MNDALEYRKAASFIPLAGTVMPLTGKTLSGLLSAVLAKGLPFRFQAKGFSMYPFIKNGDVITISPLRGAAPVFGDVAVCIDPEADRVKVHRVIGKIGNDFILKGDNCLTVDGLVPKFGPAGRVTSVERNGKRIVFGLGPERFLIAFLSQQGLLLRLLFFVKQLLQYVYRRENRE